ncbi:hypothetical protein J5I95_15065 [Candidatus Poribacteria bacterium]|nr:hypothetical protein [Candidatus Poribacteria bacterium]
MKDRRKMYRDIWPQYAPEYMPKTTLVFSAFVLIIGVLFFGYRYYVMNWQPQEPLIKIKPPVQGTPVGTPKVNAQIGAPAAQDGEIKLFSKGTPEAREAIKTWQAWEKKAEEIRAKISQASQEFFDALPETEEEIERYKTDKEWQCRVREIREKRNEIYRMKREHEEKRPPFPRIQ